MPPQRIADREIEARRGLVVVLRQRLLRRRQVHRLAGRGLVVLGRVVVLLVVEDLEADVERTIAHVGLREAEQELAADVAQVALHAERFAQAQEVVGLVVDAQEGARKPADAAVQADRVLALLLHLEQQVDRAGLGDPGGLRNPGPPSAARSTPAG